jgi:sRNA-binding protein
MNHSRNILTLNRSSRRRSTTCKATVDAKETLKRQKSAVLLDQLRSINAEVWNPSSPLPLAVGVHQQIYPLIAGVGMSRKSLRNFLAWWTGSETYQRALIQPGAMRYNLDGTEAGPVSELQSHSAIARCRLRAPNIEMNSGRKS